jgi:hypothetical protein
MCVCAGTQDMEQIMDKHTEDLQADHKTITKLIDLMDNVEVALEART